jgi:cytochrome c oxidase subunit 2
VRVVGHQWWWEFDYLSYHVVTADSLHIPAGTIVQADLASDNVIHSFWIPQLTGKTDVIPGHDNKLLFKADMNAVGRTFRGTCAEFCGAQHAHMSFNVIVDTPDAFNTWISAQQQAAAPVNTSSVACTAPIPQSDLVACGAKFFAQGACVGCHGIVGVNLTSYNDPKAAGLIGPNLTHFGSRNLIAGGVLDNDPGGKNLAIWLQNPQDVKPGSDMPNLGLSQTQTNALVAYLESLK